MRIDENRVELFSYLADCAAELVTCKEIITTKGQSVICNMSRDVSRLCPCDHEEADTKIILHLLDAYENFNEITIRTVDTDVVVLTVGESQKMENVSFGLHLGQAKIFDTFLFMKLSQPLALRKLWLYQCFMLLPAATLSPHLQILERKQHGRPGTNLMTSQQHFALLLRHQWK